MDEATAIEVCQAFLSQKELEVGEPLALVPGLPQRFSGGWAFHYQSRSYVETGELAAMLVGHGPLVVRDDGGIIEGGSLDCDPEALLLR